MYTTFMLLVLPPYLNFNALQYGARLFTQKRVSIPSQVYISSNSLTSILFFEIFRHRLYFTIKKKKQILLPLAHRNRNIRLREDVFNVFLENCDWMGFGIRAMELYSIFWLSFIAFNEWIQHKMLGSIWIWIDFFSFLFSSSESYNQHE